MRLALLVFLCINCASWAQKGNITGSVSFNNSENVVGASIALSGTTKYAITDENGRFELKGLAYGNYTLEVTSMEAKTKAVAVNLNAAVVTVNIAVEKVDASIMDELLMTKTTETRELLDKGFSVNIIDTKEAAVRNLQTNDLLDRSVGVRIRQNGGLGSSVDYNLNGMSGNSVRVFIDGIPISTYGSSFNLNSIPPALIERIEVYKGVIPAYLADDALGGAINVILKKGAKNMVNASVSYGSFNTIQSNFNATFRTKKGFTVKASGFYNYSDNDYEVWGKFVYNILPNGRYEYIRARRFNNMYRSYGGRFEAGYTDVKWADVFMIAYNGSADFNEIQHGQFMTKPYKGRFTEADAHAFSLNYAKKDFVFKGLDFNVNAVYSRRNEVVNDTVKWNYNWDGNLALGLYGNPTLTPSGAQQGAPTINHITRDVFSVRGGFNYNINQNHKIIFSNMFNMVDREDFDEMKTALERRFRETRDLQKSVSSLAYEMQAFNSNLKTSLFGKYYSQSHEQRNPVIVEQNGQSTVVEEVSKNTTSTFGYGLAASYFVLPQVMLLASAEKAVRLPNDNEIFGSPGDNISANLRLRPEVSDNLNTGFRLGAFLFKKHSIAFSASAFWRNTGDKIARQANDRVNDAIQVMPFVNLRQTQSVGFEATLEYSYNNRLFITANTSKFNSLYKLKYDNNGNILSYYNQQLPNEPFFTINGNVQYNFKDILQQNSDFNLYYNVGYVDPFYTSWLMVDATRTPAQFVQDLGLTYAFPGKQFVLGFDARNVFDKQVYDNYAVQKPGRAFYIKLNYTINNL